MRITKVTVDKIRCKKCSYEWFPKIQNDGTVRQPKICPSCHQDWRMKNVRKLTRKE